MQLMDNGQKPFLMSKNTIPNKIAVVRPNHKPWFNGLLQHPLHTKKSSTVSSKEKTHENTKYTTFIQEGKYIFLNGGAY